MSSEVPNPLDQLLQQWADGHTASDAELNQLKQRIVTNIGRETAEPVGVNDAGDATWLSRGASSDHSADRLGQENNKSQSDSTTRLHRDRTAGRFGQRHRQFALGVAAGVLLMVGLLTLWQPESGHDERPMPPPVWPPAYTWLQESQRRDKAVLLQEMESLFDGRSVWFAETGEKIDVGVLNRSKLTEADPVAVRLVVERRKVADTEWTPVWTVDVITRSEEVVRLTPKAQKATQLAMWSYVLPDGMIAIDTDLTLGDSTVFETATSSVQSDGRPVEIFSAIVDGYEIRVFQTASVLSDLVT